LIDQLPDTSVAFDPNSVPLADGPLYKLMIEVATAVPVMVGVVLLVGLGTELIVGIFGAVVSKTKDVTGEIVRLLAVSNTKTLQ